MKTLNFCGWYLQKNMNKGNIIYLLLIFLWVGKIYLWIHCESDNLLLTRKYTINIWVKLESKLISMKLSLKNINLFLFKTFNFIFSFWAWGHSKIVGQEQEQKSLTPLRVALKLKSYYFQSSKTKQRYFFF